jgi:type II secretion system protein J
MKNKFTLLEVVIAVALFAVLATACVSLMSNMSKSLDAQRERSEQVDNLVSLDGVLKKMIGHMVKFTWRDEDNQKLPHFLGQSDTMRFVQLTKVNTIADGGLRFVELFLDGEGQLVAKYQMRPFYNAVDMSEDAYSSILATNIASVLFQYASVVEGKSSSEEMEWLEEWDEDRVDIPLAVMTTLTWNDDKKETFLWRTAGNSYYERWGNWRNGESIQR